MLNVKYDFKLFNKMYKRYTTVYNSYKKCCQSSPHQWTKISSRNETLKNNRGRQRKIEKSLYLLFILPWHRDLHIQISPLVH